MSKALDLSFIEQRLDKEDLIINGRFDVAQRGTSQVGGGLASIDRWGVVGSASQTNRLGMVLPVSMRAAPSATLSGALAVYDGSATGTITAINSAYTRTSHVEFDVTTTATLNATRPAVLFQTSGGTLSLDAEL